MEEFKIIEPILAFKVKDKETSFGGKLVCFFTNSNIYHVELALENRWISAAPDTGIYINELRPLENDWEYVKLRPIKISKEVLDDLLNWIDSLHGSKYNILGIFFNQFLGLRTYNDKYFCSELAVEILSYLGYKEFFASPYYPTDFSPNDMFNYLKDSSIKLKQYTIKNRIKKKFKSIFNIFRKDK